MTTTLGDCEPKTPLATFLARRLRHTRRDIKTRHDMKLLKQVRKLLLVVTCVVVRRRNDDDLTPNR